MADTDGSVKLGVELDASTIVKSSNNLTKKISEVFKAASGKELSAGFQKLQANMDKASGKAETIRNKMEALRTVQTPEYGKLVNELNKATDALETMQAAKNRIESQDSMTDEDVQDLELLNRQIEEAIDKINRLDVAMTELEDKGMDFAPAEKDIDKYNALSNELNNVNNQMRILYESALDSGEVNVESAEKSESAWANCAMMIMRTFEDLKNGRIFKAIGDSAKAAASKMLSGFTKAAGALKNLITHAKSGRGVFNNFGNSIGGTVKKLLMLGVGITSIAMLLRRMRQGIVEGLKDMALWRGGNNAANQSISMLISSLNYLKASLASAFAPILSVVAPILSAFMDMLARAAQMVGAFFAALTGKSTYVAVTKQNTNYAASISKSTGKTKKDTKETKKNTKAKKDNAKATKEQNDKLADFDDLNVLGTEAQDDLNDALEDQPEIEEPEIETPDVGGGGGGGPQLAQYDEKQIPEWINNLVDMIKKAWKNADFTEIGRIVGEKMRDALNNASEWLVNVAQPFATKLGKSIATFLNGFFETPGLAQALGRTIGEMINTALAFVNSFLDNTHFKSIGKFIGESLTSAVNTINWKGIGHALSQGINALSGMLLGFAKSFDFRGFGNALGQGFSQAVRDLDVKQIFGALSESLAGVIEFLSGALQGINWWELGETIIQWIVDAVKGVNWTRLTESLAELIGSAVGALLAFAGGIGQKVWEFMKAAFDVAKTWIYDKAFQDGKFTIKGLFLGIVEALAGVGQWIIDHVFTPIADGFKNAFRINSPSKWAEEMGIFIMEGLFLGIQSLISKIVELWNTLKAGIKQIWESTVTEILTKVADFKTRFETYISNLKSRLETLWNNIKTSISTIWTNAVTAVLKKVQELKESAEKLIQSLREQLEDKFNTFKTNALNIWNNIKTEIEKIVNLFKEAIEKTIQLLRENIEDKFNTLKTNANTIWENIKKEVSGIAEELQKAVEKTIGTLHDNLVGDNGILTNIKKTFIQIWEDIKSGIETPINGIKELFKSIGSAAKDGINTAIDAINGLQIKIPDWVPGIGGSEWSPSIPRLAEGAVIPPNKEFLAVLGDQKNGTNIEAPLDTIVQAMQIALASNGAQNSSQNAIMTLDGQTFARLVVPHIMNELNRRGYNVTVLEA